MAKHLVIAVDWYGPYSAAEAKLKLSDFQSEGLYFALGKNGNYRSKSPQYVGISTDLKKRVNPQHTTLSKIEDIEIWLGEVGTARPSGRNIKSTPQTLDYSEWLLAYFMDVPLNKKKTQSIPDVAVSLLNRWWKKDYATPRARRPHPDWPDFIDYLGHDYPARMVWFGGRAERMKPPFEGRLRLD